MGGGLLCTRQLVSLLLTTTVCTHSIHNLLVLPHSLCLVLPIYPYPYHQ